jgi:hypothetical protein
MANIPKKLQQAEQRRKRAAAAAGLAKGAKSPLPAIRVPTRPSRAPAGRAQELPAAHYPVKRVAIGKRQAPGGADP